MDSNWDTGVTEEVIGIFFIVGGWKFTVEQFDNFGIEHEWKNVDSQEDQADEEEWEADTADFGGLEHQHNNEKGTLESGESLDSDDRDILPSSKLLAVLVGGEDHINSLETMISIQVADSKIGENSEDGSRWDSTIVSKVREESEQDVSDKSSDTLFSDILDSSLIFRWLELEVFGDGRNMGKRLYGGWAHPWKSND